MSKMIRLLKKAKQVREAQNGSLEVVSNAAQENYDAAESTPISAEHGLSVYKFSSALMVFVVFVAVASLYVSFKAIVQLEKSKEISLNLAANLEMREQKIRSLEYALADTQKENSQTLNSLRSQVKQLAITVKESDLTAKEGNQKLQSLVGEYKELKSLNEEMQATNRLLLQKYISLNQEVRQLKMKKEEDVVSLERVY